MLKIDTDLEKYYNNPIMDSWTYVSMGMDNLKSHDPEMYNKINEKQVKLLPEMKERIKDISQTCKKLGLNYTEAKFYIDQYLQKFPLSLKKPVGWDDINFIFLYLLTRILKPEVIIETGCNVGFSSTFIALAVKENNNGCKFYTIEPNLEYTWENLSFVKENNIRRQKINYKLNKCGSLCIVPSDLKEYIILKHGYPRDILPDLLKENKRVDIFFHDSDHTYRNITWECATVLPYTKIGGYILVHDILLNLPFKKIFVKRDGIIIGDNLGIFKKTNEITVLIDEQLITPMENSQINEQEYKLNKIELKSSPKTVVIQVSNDYTTFNFNIFCKQLDDKISRYLSQAERIIFAECGFFQLPDIRSILIYLQQSFDETDKIFYTNGLDLTSLICDLILSVPLSGKNIINILLPASNSYLYKVTTGKKEEDFYKIIGHIKHLLDLREKENKDNLILNFNFVATTLNIEDLPDIVRLAANMGVDKVICNYRYIYTTSQKYLSCFFKQELTNRILNEAEKVARMSNIEITLPPRFGLKDYSIMDICREPWRQIILNAQGHIFSCDTSKDINESLENKNFIDVWNSPYYQNLRKSLIEGNCSCFKHCFHANPASVNDFRSHVIHRGRKDSEIDEFWGDNF